MKKIVLSLLMFAPLLVNAHSMYPSGIDKKVIYPVNKEVINVTNLYPINTCFLVEYNGKLTTSKFCLNTNQTKKVVLSIKTGRDQTSVNEVCTVTTEDSKLRTRICSSIKHYYPYSFLRQ